MTTRIPLTRDRMERREIARFAPSRLPEPVPELMMAKDLNATGRWLKRNHSEFLGRAPGCVKRVSAGWSIRKR